MRDRRTESARGPQWVPRDRIRIDVVESSNTEVIVMEEQVVCVIIEVGRIDKRSAAAEPARGRRR